MIGTTPSAIFSIPLIGSPDGRMSVRFNDYSMLSHGSDYLLTRVVTSSPTHFQKESFTLSVLYSVIHSYPHDKSYPFDSRYTFTILKPCTFCKE